MKKSTAKMNRVSGLRIAVMIISILLLSFIMAFSMLLGISILKQHGPIVIDENATTVRKRLPTDGTLPTSASPLDNIGYMAYVLDNQPFYHVYAYNSTKSTGYEQVTQSWKDYRNAELSGAGLGVMVCSDLSYSALVKSSSQSCFIGSNEAHLRSGNKPAKSSTPLDIDWSADKPSIYDKNGYKYAYGEFSTEISVYVINEQTLSGADDVIDNGDGTYSQKYYLHETAACWYQYGMKTRGGLKSFPEFKRIEITFTFDSNWQVLQSYCEEKATISPRALGGMNMDSNAKTTTTYYYGEEDFDNEHFAYYEDFFKKYQGSKPSDNEPAEEEPEVLDILGSGFSKVIGGGQQFSLSLTLGNTEYDGKVFLSLPDMGDVLGTLDARVSLEKKGSGKQDFYAEFRNGTVNVYYSTDFAMTADIGQVSQSVSNIIDWVKGINSQPVALAADDESSGIDIGSLVNDLTRRLTENEAYISLQSENLLGLGVGVDVVFVFDRIKDDGGDSFSIKSFNLNYIKYDGTPFDLKASIVPDDGAIISRQTENTPANLADYADSVYKLLSGNTVKVELGLDDSLIEGLTLNAEAYVSIGSRIAANVKVTAAYKGVSVKLDASYVYESSYGKLYLRVTEINGTAVDAKIFCDIGDAVKTVSDLISKFGSDENGEAQTGAAASGLADIINKVLNLNFSQIIGKVSGNSDAISLEINADALLSGLGVSLGIDFGTLAITFDNVNASFYGSVSSLGLNVAVSGSDNELPLITDTENYVDLNLYLDSASALFFGKQSYSFGLSFTGNDAVSTDIDLTGLSLDVSAQLAFKENYSGLNVNIDSLAVEYKNVSVVLSAHYTVNFDGSYGVVYLDILNVNGVELNGAKVQLDITAAAGSIKNVINAFSAPSAQAYAAENDVVSKIIGGVLKLDFNELLFATDEKATVRINLDTLLSEFDLGFSFGTVILEYAPAEYEVTGSAPQIGLNRISFSGSDNALPAFTAEGYIDLNGFIDGVENIVGSSVYEIGIDFTGGKITDKADLTGLSLNATAYVKLENGYDSITVNVPVLVSYYGLEAELSVYYTFDMAANGYGTVYIDLKRIDNITLNAKVYCDVQDAVNAVKEIIGAFASPAANSEESSDVISKLIGIVLNLDYANIIKASKDNLSVTINADEILSALDINIGGIEFGDIQLGLALDNAGGAVLYGEIEKLNLSVNLKGNDAYRMPAAPASSEYLDLTAVINLVRNIIDEGKAIAEAEGVTFAFSGTATAGGTQFALDGSGEVIWADNSVRAAVALTVKVDNETLEINFVYDETVPDSEPFVIITINDAGVRIYRSETDTLVKSFKGLIEAFSGSENTENEVSAYALSVGGTAVEEIVGNENLRNVLNALLGFANEFAVEIETADAAEAIYNLLISHTDGLAVTIGADGCLSVELTKSGAFSFGATVEAGSGLTIAAIRDLTADEKYNYYGISDFVKTLYTNFFDKAEEISLRQLLGDNPYSVKLNVMGANSGIEVLEAVSVKAELYYDEGVAGTVRATKLMHVNLEMDINGTNILATASYSGRTLFIELNRIGGTTFTGIKFRTDVENVFDAVEELVRFITDTNLVETINRFTGKGTLTSGEIENIAAFASLTDESGNTAPSMLSKLLDALLTLNLEQSFSYDKTTNTARINVDGIAEALLGIKIGTITASFNGEAHALSAKVGVDNNDAWLTLDAAPCERREGVINPDDYMDIGFVSTLVSDVVATVTDEGNRLYSLYTFVGSIAVDVTDIPVLGDLNIRFNNATLTVGLDGKNQFYLTLAASLQKTSALGFAVTAARDISITYSNGLIVFGRDIGTSSEIYKVVTLEYLLDNLLDKDNSPVRWLLGTSDFVWGKLADNVNLNIESGLTKPKTYTLYEQLVQNVKENKINLSDYLSGMIVKAGGDEPLSVYGNGAALATDKFKLSGDNNHYAFDINSKELTGGTISALCAVIFRNDNGLSGIKAYGEVGSMVSFTVDFGTYLEGVTELYGGKVFNIEQVNIDENTFYGDFAEAENVTENNFADRTYYRYDGDSGEYAVAVEYEEGIAYFVKVNSEYYVMVNGDTYLAAEYDANETYFRYVEADSTKNLGEVAVRNYLDYVTENFGFDVNHEFTNDTPHINSIFGCFNTEDRTYYTSDELETIYLDVYTDLNSSVPERTLEVLYGSTVKLISDFPEFADENKTLKLTYVDANGEPLPDTIIIADGEVEITYVDGKGRVSICKSSEAAVEVVFNFVGISGMQPVSAALAYGDSLAEYVLHDYSFLGWFKDASFKTPVTRVNRSDVSDGKITVYGMYIKTLYEAENGVNYSFDSRLNSYYVSGVNSNISVYYNNANLWLEIADEINGYPVVYIAEGAFANAEDDIYHSLVNVLVPESVVAVYDKAFLDNKALCQVVFFADKVFFGGRADSNGKTSVFYGCYTSVSGSTNTAFTVYYNGTQNNPYSHVSTTNNAIDSAWNRIYFNKPTIGSSTSYVMLTKSSGWAFAQFETVVTGLDGNSSVLPAEIDLSGIIYDGLRFTAYGEAGNLANEISDLLIAQLGRNIYDVTVSAALPVNGKRHYITVTITEHEEIIATKTDIAVTVAFGNTELYSGTAEDVEADATLADIYTALGFDGKDGYVFLGWYKDAALTQLAPATNDGTVDKLFAKLVLKNVTAANGVTYEFVAASDTVAAHYAVSGFTGTGADGVDYTQNSAWLILDNEISGFPVTEIKNEAFSKKNIKNVVVPSNITTVGTKAFLDNYGMLNAVFLADNVTMNGSVSGKDLPFYGCSTGSGTSVTYLNVYYNGVTPEEQWNHFRDGNNYIGIGSAGGSINGAGTWGYVTFTVTDGYFMSDFGYTDGLIVTAVDDTYLSAVKASVISMLNSNSSYDGVIYSYSVTVTDTVKDGIHFITVTIAEDASNAWNKLVVDGSDIQIEKTADIETVNGTYFVKPGATVTVKPVSGNEGLTRLTVYADTDKSAVVYDSGEVAVTATLTFGMPSQFVFITAERHNLPITEITLKSVVEVNGFDYSESGVYEMQLDINEGDPLSYTVSADGYTFIGWAYENSEHLLEFETTVQHRSYYAVWAYNRTEVTNVKLDNGAFTADSDYTIYGWYTYNAVNDKEVFDTPVTAQSLTHSTTVIYPRLVFTLTYSMTSNLSGTNTYFVDSNENSPASQEVKVTTGSFKMLEGTELEYRWTPSSTSTYDVDKVLWITYVNENNATSRIYFRIKNKANFIAKNNTCTIDIQSRTFKNSYILAAGDVYTCDVNGDDNMTITATGV